jgi:predicted Rossmann fold flavoprotein
MSRDAVDLVIVGAGAAGLAAAIFAARRAPAARVVLVDGARRIGAKVLISGGGRCNVTNRHVAASDFWGGPRRVVASVLRAFPAQRSIEFFERLGVPLHEEERGKLFPDSNRARSVLDALLGEAGRLGVAIASGVPARSVERGDGHWRVQAGDAGWDARRVILATGGLSVPKTGSDGSGLRMAEALGHAIVPTTPALVPLKLEGTFHEALSGVSHEAAIEIAGDGKVVERVSGPLLWTHFGISGPAALDASRHWLRVVEEGRIPGARLSFTPGLDFAAIDGALTPKPGDRAPATVRAFLCARLPAAVADAMLAALAIAGGWRLAQLPRDERRRLVHALTAWELRVAGSRGYNYAEATAGGVALDEVDHRTLESRRRPGLHFAGEILDVDGRLGGFNFQWAWSSGFVAGTAAGAGLT